MKKNTILITGVSGLIGTGLRKALLHRGFEVRGLDIRGKGAERGDVRNESDVERSLRGCCGVIHLAAVSRVIDGERDPERCWDVNVNGITNVLKGIIAQERTPWLIFASSREVYGNAEKLPVREDFPMAPINIYGESKVQSEKLVEECRREHGLLSAVLRFSNVFGGINDHTDRVIPAFVSAALYSGTLRVDGDENTFDFTFLPDVIRGILFTVEHLINKGESLSPVHLVAGRPTTLRELAELTIKLLNSDATIVRAPSRDYDVGKFYGCTERAHQVLGWKHSTSLESGLLQLAQMMSVPSDLLTHQ